MRKEEKRARARLAFFFEDMRVGCDERQPLHSRGMALLAAEAELEMLGSELTALHKEARGDIDRAYAQQDSNEQNERNEGR